MHVSLQSQKLTHNNYKNMIPAWLRSHCIVLHLCSTCIFLAENKSALIARRKWILILMYVSQIVSQSS